MAKMEKDRVDTLRGIIAHEIEKNPHNRELLNAFQPLLLERMRLLKEIKLKKADPAAIDKTRFLGGVPLIRQQDLLLPDDPWEETAGRLIPALKEGFPGIRGDMDSLQSGSEKLSDLFHDYRNAFPDHAEEAIGRGALDLQVSAQGISLLLRHLTRIFLERRMQAVDEEIKGLEWKKGFCPVCGAFPTIALIEDKITRRWLHCSRCGQDWLFSRVICPYCENEAQQGMDFFYLETNPQESAFTCTKCNRYLITLNRISDLQDHDPDVSAIGLAHLDIIMQNKGFVPMTACEWNTF
ncbi:MAG: formate dehydrogenase accessory protein FdhE [Syntrophaceae bacterium PtaB.Bin095]|jgi:FdhE protein|nr:MAG: formate dehydrogenase accessory protein FdhE [Syntrophaceae bacterium PtaB.Bin095]